MSDKLTNESAEVATPTSQDQGADDLESLLSEYESSVPKQEPPKDEAEPEDPVRAYVEQKMQQDQQAEMDKGLAEARNALRAELDDLPIKVGDKVLTGLLHAKAAEDPRVAQAFNERGRNPAAWNKILKGIAKEAKAEFSIDAQVTQDKQAMAAAVRGSTSSKPSQDDAPDFASMSDAEFQRYAHSIK